MSKLTAVTSLFLLSAIGSARAGEPTPPDASRGTPHQIDALEEVIITATRRPTSLQDVSMSVTAVDGELVRALGIENGQQIANLVPNFTVQSTFGPASPPYMNIRGVSYVDFDFVNEMSIGTYVDEAYQGHQGSVSGQLFDLERVEVLRGPQGTLFGRNTTGGLVHFISRKPSEATSGYFSMQIGSFDQFIAEGAIGGQLARGVRGRVAVKYNIDDGIRQNRGSAASRFGKTDVAALRGTLQFDVGQAVTTEFSAHYSKSDSTFAGYAFYGNLDPVTFSQCSVEAVLNSRCVNEAGFLDPNPSADHTNSRHRSLPNQSENAGGYIKVEWSPAWGRLTSISAYEDVKTYVVQDITATADALVFIDTQFDSDMHQFSQELRADGSTERLDWLLGAYYYEDQRNARVD
ncbi:MAG: TonB-dependent receptor, partial [Dehalococcoidia bacterium]